MSHCLVGIIICFSMDHWANLMYILARTHLFHSVCAPMPEGLTAFAQFRTIHHDRMTYIYLCKCCMLSVGFRHSHRWLVQKQNTRQMKTHTQHLILPLITEQLMWAKHFQRYIWHYIVPIRLVTIHSYRVRVPYKFLHFLAITNFVCCDRHQESCHIAYVNRINWQFARRHLHCKHQTEECVGRARQITFSMILLYYKTVTIHCNNAM